MSDMPEMANLYDSTTGLPVVVWNSAVPLKGKATRRWATQFRLPPAMLLLGLAYLLGPRLGPARAIQRRA